MFVVILAKKDLEMYRENSKNSKNNKFNKDCKLYQKFGSTFFSQFSYNSLNRNCLQKSKEACKNRKGNRTLHCGNKKTPL